MIPVLAVGSGDSGLIRDLAIIMAVAGVALVVFRLVRMPSVLGYLTAGVLIGPYTFRDPLVENLDTIRLLADLGLVLLLFGVGLGVGWQRIRSVGLRVIIIGGVEMTIMFALGLGLAILLGWTHTEGVFLGAALAISSSAILMTMLRESGELQKTRGQLIVGILVIEDIAAVILLTVLSGVAAEGATNPGAIGLLAAKLATFGVAVLVLGGLVAPRVTAFVNGFQSQEAMLVTGLALCFGLALAAEQLGLSAAAGAFLIGAVLGDTRHAEDMDRTMGPVRDMFAAIFFVSIGMLMDLSVAVQFILPTLAVAGVFIVGKVVADTIGTILSGHSGRESLDVGLGMPQVGEFSLAMIRVGVEHGAVGAFMYPVLTGATAITALAYPFLFRSTNVVAGFLDRRTPRILKAYGGGLILAMSAMYSAFRFRSPRARRIRHSSRMVVLNMVIVSLFLAIGTGSLHFTPQLSRMLNARESVVALVIAGVVLALTIPPAFQVWRSLRSLSDAIVQFLLPEGLWSSEFLRGRNIQGILLDTMTIPLAAPLLIVAVIWSFPLLSELVSIGGLLPPLAIAIAVTGIIVMAAVAFRLHRVLEPEFMQTFLGLDEHEDEFPSGDQPNPQFEDDDKYTYEDDHLEAEYTQILEQDTAASRDRDDC